MIDGIEITFVDTFEVPLFEVIPCKLAFVPISDGFIDSLCV